MFWITRGGGEGDWAQVELTDALFWYKVFVYWKLKLLNFLMDSVLIYCTTLQHARIYRAWLPSVIFPNLW